MFRGHIVALVTPMYSNGDINFDSFSRLIKMHIDAKTSALVVAGSTGESNSLTEIEFQQLIEHAVEEARGRIPIIAGTGGISTAKTINTTKLAKELGADACLIVTPPYIKPTQEGLYQHYASIAASVAIPIMLYNVPSRTASDLLPETVVRLSSLDNIIGIKEATDDLTRLSYLRHHCHDDFLLLTGDDSIGKEFMLLGGDGIISVTGNVAPIEMKALCEAALSGDREQATLIEAKLQPLYEVLFAESNPIPVKWALEAMGIMDATTRLPLTRLSACYHTQVYDALKSASLIQSVEV